MNEHIIEDLINKIITSIIDSSTLKEFIRSKQLGNILLDFISFKIYQKSHYHDKINDIQISNILNNMNDEENILKRSNTKMLNSKIILLYLKIIKTLYFTLKNNFEKSYAIEFKISGEILKNDMIKFKTNKEKHEIDLESFEYDDTVETFLSIISFTDNIRKYESILIKILGKTKVQRKKILILELFKQRFFDFKLEYDFFQNYFLRIGSLLNEQADASTSYIEHVLCLEIMKCLVKKNTNFKYDKLYKFSKDAPLKVKIAFALLYEAWYFSETLCQNLEQYVIYLNDKEKDSDKKYEYNVHIENLFMMVLDTIHTGDNRILKLFRNLLCINPSLIEKVAVRKIMPICYENYSMDSLFIILNFAVSHCFNRFISRLGFEIPLIVKIHEKIIRKKIDLEFTIYLILIEKYMPEIEKMIIQKNMPIMEMILAVLENKNNTELLEKTILKIIKILLGKNSKYNMIFIENDGLNIVKKRFKKFKKIVSKIFVNFTYHLNLEEKKKFLDSIKINFYEYLYFEKDIELVHLFFCIYKNIFYINFNKNSLIIQYLIKKTNIIEILKKSFTYFIYNLNIKILNTIIITISNLISIISCDDFLTLDYDAAIEESDHIIIYNSVLWLLINLAFNRNEKSKRFFKFKSSKDLIQKIKNKNGVSRNEIFTLEEKLKNMR